MKFSINGHLWDLFLCDFLISLMLTSLLEEGKASILCPQIKSQMAPAVKTNFDKWQPWCNDHQGHALEIQVYRSSLKKQNRKIIRVTFRNPRNVNSSCRRLGFIFFHYSVRPTLVREISQHPPYRETWGHCFGLFKLMSESERYCVINY